MEAMSVNYALHHPSTPSQTSLTPSGTSHTHTSSSTSNPHRGHQALDTSKLSRGRSLSLIGATRVKLAKDLRYLVRANSPDSSFEHRYPRLRPVRRAKTGPSDAEEPSLPPNVPYLPSQASKSGLGESMEDLHEERKGRRGLGARIVGFLNRSRSRSRSKKRRSKSLENIGSANVAEMPKPSIGGSLGRRNPYAAQGETANASASSSSAAPASRPPTRSPSRPLSGATTATDTTAKPSKKLARSPTKSRDMSSHHVHLQADVLAANPADPSRKGKKTNFFSVAISHPRKQEPTDDRHGRQNSTSQTPDNGRVKRWSSGRFKSGSGSSVGTQSTHASNEHSGPPQDTPPPVPPKPGSSSQPSRPLRVEPPERSGTYTSLNSPPPPYRFDDFENAPPEIDLGGRCSPLCGLPSPRLTPPISASEKGKERERVMAPLGRRREGAEKQERRNRIDVEITHPRRVGSPQPRERESRMGRATPVPVDKVASNTGSGNSKKSAATKESSASIPAWAKRAKHGSFDFERPSSVTGGALNVRTALRGMGVTFDGPPAHLERSKSTKESAPRTHTVTTKPQSSSLPSSAGRKVTRPSVDISALPIARHPTESSQGGSTSSAGRSYFNYGDSNPVSPISSNSGHSSSWGRKAGARGNIGPFKFEPAVPPIPGSPASDERPSQNEREPSDRAPPPPTKHRAERTSSKGRSLDLGLHLNWAPQRVREEALLPGAKSATPGRAAPRWGGMADDHGRLDATSSRTATEISRAFKDALGDRAYSTFKIYVHRFDAHAIPLEGPYGLVAAASRLLDTAATLDERGKRALLDKFVRFVQETQ